MAMEDYNLPTTALRNCVNGTDGTFYCLGQWGSDVTQGFWWLALLIGFCFALFMATFRYGTTRAFGFASVVGLLGSIYLSILGYLPWWITSAFILVGAVGFAAMIISQK